MNGSTCSSEQTVAQQAKQTEGRFLPLLLVAGSLLELYIAFVALLGLSEKGFSYIYYEPGSLGNLIFIFSGLKFFRFEAAEILCILLILRIFAFFIYFVFLMVYLVGPSTGRMKSILLLGWTTYYILFGMTVLLSIDKFGAFFVWPWSIFAGR